MAMQRPVRIRKLKIPNQLRLDFAVLTWYSSSNSGLAHK